MTKRILIAATAVLLIAAFAVPATAGNWFNRNHIEGSGDLETRDFDFDDFKAIELNGGLDIEITVGEKQSVAITLDDNLFDNLEMDVSGGTLLIEWEESCDSHRKSKVVITMPKLEEIELNGAGDVVVERFRGDAFKFRLRGAGDLTIEGEVDELDISLSGAGDINARKLKAKNVDVTVSGVGTADVTALDSIDARVSGVGDINYWGDPEHEKTRVSGLGDIDKK